MKQRKICRLLIAIAAVCILMSPESIDATDCEVDYDGVTNHYEWANVCIYANDVEYTQAELLNYIHSGTLPQHIISDCQAEVRVGHDYAISSKGIVRIDVSNIEQAINEEGYLVTLYTSESGVQDYIGIRVFITPNPINTEKQQEEPIEETPPVIKEYEKIPEPIYWEEGVLLGASFMILLLETVIAIPKIYILSWYRKKRKGGIK